MSEIPIKNIGSATYIGDSDCNYGLYEGNRYRVLSKNKSLYKILSDNNMEIYVAYENLDDIVINEVYNHVNPDHYKTNDKEVWEYMIEIYGLEKFIAFCELNVFKYSMRVGRKPGATVEDDLGKIKWYAEKIKELRDDERT